MADELTVSVAINFSKAGITGGLAQNGKKVTVAGSKRLGNVQTVTASAAALNLGGLTVGGYLLAVNRSTAAIISFRVGAAGVDFARLKPGEAQCFRLGTGLTAGNALNVITDTGTGDLDYEIVDD